MVSFSRTRCLAGKGKTVDGAGELLLCPPPILFITPLKAVLSSPQYRPLGRALAPPSPSPLTTPPAAAPASMGFSIAPSPPHPRSYPLKLRYPCIFALPPAALHTIPATLSPHRGFLHPVASAAPFLPPGHLLPSPPSRSRCRRGSPHHFLSYTPKRPSTPQPPTCPFFVSATPKRDSSGLYTSRAIFHLKTLQYKASFVTRPRHPTLRLISYFSKSLSTVMQNAQTDSNLVCLQPSLKMHIGGRPNMCLSASKTQMKTIPNHCRGPPWTLACPCNHPQPDGFLAGLLSAVLFHKPVIRDNNFCRSRQ